MRILIKLLALCCAMFICGTASAAMKAGELRDLCTSDTNWKKAACIMYIEGFRDGHQIGMHGAAGMILSSAEVKNINWDEEYQRFSFFCLTSAVANGQLMEVFVKFMNEHPEKLHLDAGLMLTDAFIQYFPCKRDIKGGAK